MRPTSSVPLDQFGTGEYTVNVAALGDETFRGQQEVLALESSSLTIQETTSDDGTNDSDSGDDGGSNSDESTTDGDDDSTTDGDSDDSTGDDENNGNPVQMVHPVMRIRPQTQKAHQATMALLQRQTMRLTMTLMGQRQTGQMGLGRRTQMNRMMT